MQKKCIFVLPSKSKKYFIMEQRNNKQDLIIFEIENLLNKMSNQVNFLIRKEMTMNQLDVDLLMENTRKLYDTICSVELGVRSEELGVRSEELGVNDEEDADTDTDSELIDSSTDRLIDFVPVPVPVPEEEIEEIEEELIPEENPIPEKEADMVWDFTIDNEESGVRIEELGVDDDEDADSELIDSSTDRLIDTDSDTNTELIDSSTDRLIDSVPVPEEKSVPEEEDSGIRTYKIVRENVHTLGDVLEKTEDNSLAARLQRKPVSDLISAIGINDKFLFLNELFGGSMEKYNKSIRSLNSFSTLLGAKTYMSELQIEFQWDCNSDAYKKLADLVERRFI